MVELKHLSVFPQEVIALDEVGRSPLSGPVVIGAVKLRIDDPEKLKSLGRFLRRKRIKDSKLLSADKRAEILALLGVKVSEFRQTEILQLKGFDLHYVTWEMDHEIIDKENILQASLRGMKEAAMKLAGDDKTMTTLLIDGHLRLRWGEGAPPWKEIPIAKGDVKSVLIGLAAIIAKEKRDALMKQMHELYPQYGFSSNMGYPTPEHRKAIALYGPCPIHRKSFAKVKEFLPEAEEVNQSE